MPSLAGPPVRSSASSSGSGVENCSVGINLRCSRSNSAQQKFKHVFASRVLALIEECAGVEPRRRLQQAAWIDRASLGKDVEHQAVVADGVQIVGQPRATFVKRLPIGEASAGRRGRAIHWRKSWLRITAGRDSRPAIFRAVARVSGNARGKRARSGGEPNLAELGPASVAAIRQQ